MPSNSPAPTRSDLTRGEILDKIFEKEARYMANSGHEAKYIIIDSTSYMTLDPQSSEMYINGQFSRLTFIVLPQINRRIQVIGGNPMETAHRTLSDRNV
jgi:hypothetical protein